jgi:hypothetical protein
VLGLQPLGESLDGRLVRHVEGHADRLAGQGLRDRRGAGAVEVGHPDEPGALGGEALGEGAADAARPAGDDHNRTQRSVSHGSPSCPGDTHSVVGG